MRDPLGGLAGQKKRGDTTQERERVEAKRKGLKKMNLCHVERDGETQEGQNSFPVDRDRKRIKYSQINTLGQPGGFTRVKSD